MALLNGARLGTYVIVAPIGAGGMGEVYRARDTKLDRDVAIKVLPDLFATDPERLARFEREAKAVAALSHPNILAIHDFGADGGTAYAVMELLEGETLRERLAEGAMPPKKCLAIGAQIASGLAAAHDKHIVHRDLKPENVFLGVDGRVKILDFGLARQIAAPAGEASDSPTRIRDTDPGTVMGTVGYMSPEQVKAQPTDHRSDIFAFGCLLFEMATGRRAFHRETAAETMTAILREDPVEATRDQGALPVALDPIVRHCLEKRPDERFQSARDLGFALQSLSGGSTASGPAVPVAPTAPRSARRWLPVAAAAIVAAGAFAAGRVWPAGSSGSPGSAIVGFQQVTDVPGVESMPTLSPDGKTIAYVSSAAGEDDIYLQRIGSRSAQRLTTGSSSANIQPAFSPDGEHIAFRSSRDGGGIFLMTVSGESVTRVTDFGYSPSWSPDGTAIVVAAGGFEQPMDRGSSALGLWVVDLRARQKREVTDVVAMQPAWSPHGQRIAYWALRGTSGQRDLWTVAADGSDGKNGGVGVTDDAPLDWSPTWSPDGRYLYFSSTRGGTMNLWRIAIDEASGRVEGAPEPVMTPSTYAGYPSFSRDGLRLAYASLDWRSTLFRVGFDAARGALAGSPIPVLKSTRPIRDHEVSPDGEWVAFNETAPQEDLFVARLDGREYRRLTDDAFRDRGPTWAPDGRRIVFYSDRGGGYELWTIRPDGSGLEALTHKVGQANFSVFSPDGSRIAFSGVGMGAWFIINAESPATDLKSEPAPSETEAFWPLSWSADDARIAGHLLKKDGSSAGLAVYTLATRRFARVPVPGPSSDTWLMMSWLHDGRRLIVRGGDGIALVNADTGERKVLVSVRGYAIGRSVGVSHDDKWITYTETGTEGDIWLATLKK
jgi:Tol biopolymer transport system component